MDAYSFESLTETIRFATREEAMARSKGWDVADDWMVLIRKLTERLRMSDKWEGSDEI